MTSPPSISGMIDELLRGPGGENNSDVDNHAENLRHQLLKINKLAEIVSSELRKRSAELQEQLNAYIPINALPAELFLGILQYAFQGLSPVNMLSVSTVCKYWHNSVLGCPTFWTSVDLGEGHGVSAMKLRRSRKAPLVVRCMVPTSRVDGTNMALSFVLAVSRHSERWRSIAIHIPRADDIRHLLRFPSPALSDVFLRFNRLDEDSPQILLSDGPPLRRVHLHSATLQWDSWRLRELKYLQLSDIAYGAPDVTQVREIISKSPQLEKLILYKWPNYSTERHPPSQEPIDLPHLSALYLGDIPEDVTSNLISTIQPSTHCSLYLKDIDAELLPVLSNRLPAPLSSARAIHLTTQNPTPGKAKFSLCTSPSPAITSYEVEPWSMGIEVGVYVLFTTDSPAHQLRELVRILNSIPSLPPLVFECGGLDSHRPFPVDVFDNLPTVESLALSRAPEAHDIMGYLGRPVGTDWPCPNLKKVKVKNGNGIRSDAVWSFREDRWGSAGQCLDGVLGPGLAPLEDFLFR